MWAGFLSPNFFETHMENIIDNSLFGSEESKAENINTTENVSQVPAINNALEHIKAGGTIALIPKDSEAIIIRQDFSPEIKQRVEDLTIELTGVGPIINQDSAAKANASLKKAKQLIKFISEERKLMTSVLDEKKKSYIAHEEKIVEQLSKTVEIINNNITNFQKAELKKQQELEEKLRREREEEQRKIQEEANRKAGIQKKILDFENSVIAACGSATINDIDDKIKKLASIKINKDTYMEFLREAEIMYQRCVTRMNERKTELMQLAEVAKKNQEEADRMKKEQEEKHANEAKAHVEKSEEKLADIEEEKQMEVANSQMNFELKVSTGEKVKGVQQRWTFDESTIDMGLLPEEYKTFDVKKIKEAISNGAREIPGVRIYQDVVNVSR
jgi:DNA repair exonuclease SbcCD ATPase subunit